MEYKSLDHLRKLQKQIDAIRKKSDDFKFHCDTDNIDKDEMGYSNEDSQ